MSGLYIFVILAFIYFLKKDLMYFWLGSSVVERRTENPCVAGSIPAQATMFTHAALSTFEFINLA